MNKLKRLILIIKEISRIQIRARRHCKSWYICLNEKELNWALLFPSIIMALTARNWIMLFIALKCKERLKLIQKGRLIRFY